METTLVLVKPDGVQRRLVGRIVARFEEKGLQIVGLRLMRLERPMLEKHYAAHKAKPFYEGLVTYMASSPVVAVALRGKNAVAVVRKMMGATFGSKAEPGTVRGDFAFADGVARTDNMHIDGPAAEIRVSGSTQMRDKLYDQRVEVLPKAGGVLPVVGFLVGGPAGAAVGAVAQGVFNKPLKQTTRVVYHVSGPWEKPVVKVVEKGPAKGAASSQTTPPPAATAMEKR